MSARRSVAAIAALTLTVSGCSDEGPDDVSADEPPAATTEDTSPDSAGDEAQAVDVIGSDPSALVRRHAPDPSDGRHASAVSGSVAVSDSGCLVLVDEGDHAWTMVLPHGSDLVDGEATLPDGESLAVGDEIDRAGMWADPALVILPEKARQCPADGFALLFPPDDDESTGR